MTDELVLTAAQMKAMQQLKNSANSIGVGMGTGTAVFPSPTFQYPSQPNTQILRHIDPRLRFAVRTVVNGYIIEYAEHEGQLMQEIVCKTLEEVSAEVVRIIAANKLAGK